MNANEFIPLLGMIYDDEDVKRFLTGCGITKKPKMKQDSSDAYLVNKKLGLDITFTDERDVEVTSREYQDGALVLSNIRMYGEGSSLNYQRFNGELPHGLSFDLGLLEVQAKFGRKPSAANKNLGITRWDFKTYCLFINFDKTFKRIQSLAIQLPVE